MICLAQTAILLAAAVVAVSLLRFLRLSSIPGYLAAGLAIGPWAAQQLEKLFEADRSRAP